MKPSTAGGFLLAALLGGAMGSWMTISWTTTSAEKEKLADAHTVTTAQPEDSDGEESPRDRISNLEHKVMLLTAALTKQSSQSDKTRRALAGDEATEFSDVADPVFEAAVLDILDRQSEREEEEQNVFRAELRAKQGKQLAAQLNDALQLTGTQQEQIANAVTQYFEQMWEVRRDDNPNRPVTRKEWREQMRALNEGADKAMANILTPDQLKAYDALDDDEKLGFRRGRAERERSGSSDRSEARARE